MRKKMYKKLKKGLALGLVAIMPFSMLSGCGSKKETKTSKVDIELSELLSKAVLSIEDMEQIKVGLNGNVDVSIDMEEINMDAGGKIGFNVIASMDNDSPKFNSDGSLDLELGSGTNKFTTSYNLKSYGETQDGELYGYVQYNDEEWIKEKGDISEYLDEIKEMKESIKEVASTIEEVDLSMLEMYEDYIRLESETQTVDGVECYVISANVDKDGLLKLIQEINEEYTAEEFEEELEVVDNFDMELKVFFDKDSYMPVKFIIDLKMALESDDERIEVNKFNLEITIGVNTFDKIESVPDNVKESAVDAEDADISLGSLLY